MSKSKAFAVCRCEKVKCIVLGSKEFAYAKMKDLKKEYEQKMDKEYGKTLAKEYKKMIFWEVKGPIPIITKNKEI